MVSKTCTSQLEWAPTGYKDDTLWPLIRMVTFLHTYSVFTHLVVSHSATPWTGAHQAPLSMGFSRQEYWSGLPFPSPGDLPDPGSNPGLPHCRQTLYNLRHQRSPVYTILPYREAYIYFLFPHLSLSTQILFECSLALLLVSCVFILYCFPLSLFISFKLCNYDNTFTEELGKYRTKLRIVPLHMTIIFWVGKLKFFIGSFDIKLSKIDRISKQESRRVYSRSEKYHEPIQHNWDLYSLNSRMQVLFKLP